jgi:hypothetical protein
LQQLLHPNNNEQWKEKKHSNALTSRFATPGLTNNNQSAVLPHLINKLFLHCITVTTTTTTMNNSEIYV